MSVAQTTMTAAEVAAWKLALRPVTREGKTVTKRIDASLKGKTPEQKEQQGKRAEWRRDARAKEEAARSELSPDGGRSWMHSCGYGPLDEDENSPPGRA